MLIPSLQERMAAPPEKQYNANRLPKNFRNPLYVFENPIAKEKAREYFIKLIADEFIETGKKFEMTAILQPKINFCLNWVYGYGIDYKENKGLQLFGPKGLGKSSIIKAVNKLVNELYPDIKSQYLTANRIASYYRSNGEESELNINKIIYCKVLFIDDIGTEDEQVFKSFPIQEIIRERYDRKKITSFTTNLQPFELAKRYTESIEDKLNHGTYRIEFNGNSQRK